MKSKGREYQWKREKTTNKHTCENTDGNKSFKYNKVYLHKYRKENLEQNDRT